MNQPQHIRNLVLDFGGVIYTISHKRHKDAFAALGIENFGQLYSQASQSPLFADLECGRIGEEDFHQGLLDVLGREFDKEKIDAAWNSILVGFEDERIELLGQLRQKYRLYLLSNTNVIHYRIYTQEFLNRYGYDFNKLFHQTYWSFKIGMRKPDAEIYRHVMEENGLVAAETLFIDDTKINVTSSVQAGMPALWLPPGLELKEFFDESLGLKL
ncbi:MAG: HAD family hydrolase [Bacteroidales bacterium]